MKPRTIIYSKKFNSSFDERIEYYAKELNDKSLAKRFTNSVRKVIKKISENAELYPQYYDKHGYDILDNFNIHKVGVDGFSEIIFYQYDVENASIILIEHGSRLLGKHLSETSPHWVSPYSPEKEPNEQQEAIKNSREKDSGR